jgi:hypothetical protein
VLVAAKAELLIPRPATTNPALPSFDLIREESFMGFSLIVIVGESV